MRVGFLVGNKFQIAHFAELMAQFEDPDVIFFDRDLNAFQNFNPQCLTRYGAFCRFVHEADLDSLDGQYDVIFAQINPPLKEPWGETKLIMTQYSMAKPKVAYGARFLVANGALVYGDYSADVIGKMCPAIIGGNSRFDPYFEDRLDAEILAEVSGRLDPAKKTLTFLPTWGDLNSQDLFQGVLEELAQDYNVLYKPHHNTARSTDDVLPAQNGIIDLSDMDHVLDIGPYLMKVTDLVVSEASGAIFDALYCGKPVVLLSIDLDLNTPHRKMDSTALEVSETHRIGPVVTEIIDLKQVVDQAMGTDNPFYDANEALVKEAFLQRGGCAPIAAQRITDFVMGPYINHHMQDYAVPSIRTMILRRAFKAAETRSKIRMMGSYKDGPDGKSWKRVPVKKKHHGRFKKTRAFVMKTVLSMPIGMLEKTTKVVQYLGNPKVTHYFATRLEEARDQILIKKGESYNPRATVLPATAARKISRIRHLEDNDRFMDLGFQVEAWANLSAQDTLAAQYHFTGAVSNLRFSRLKMRSLVQKLEAFVDDPMMAPPKARSALWKNLGQISKALQLDKSISPKEYSNLSTAKSLLGDTYNIYLDTAGANEAVALADQKVINPDGEMVMFGDATGPIFELSILLGFSRVVVDEKRHTRDAMLSITRELIDGLHAEGWTILPRLQAGFRGTAPNTGKFPCATWHTKHAQVPNQIHLKVGSYGGYIVVDDRGYSGWASLAHQPLETIIRGISKKSAEEQYQFLQDTLLADKKTKYAQPEEDTVIPAEKYIFFPMQILTDTVAKLAHLNGLQVLEILAEWAKTSEYAIVVKRHPKCTITAVADALDQAVELGDIILSDANIHTLITGADGVVTVNSGAGAEALLYLKPVITTGDSDYAAATRLVSTEEELLEALETFIASPISEDKLKKFLWVFSKRYQLNPTDTTAIRSRLKALL